MDTPSINTSALPKIANINVIMNGSMGQDALEAWNRDLAILLVPLDVFLGLYIILGVLGNLVVIYVYKYKMKKKIEDRFFILVLAVLDISVCTTASPMYMVFNILPVMFHHHAMACIFSWFISRTLSNTSGILILVIAIQRYLKVCRPFGWQLTLPRQKIAVGSLLFFSFIIDIPLFFFYGKSNIYNPLLKVNGSRCGRRMDLSEGMEFGLDLFYIGMFVTAVVTMVGISIVYILIGHKIYTQTKKKRAMQGAARLSRVQTEAPNEEESYAESRADTTQPSTTTNTQSSAPKPEESKKKRKKKSRNPFVTYKYSIMFMTISAASVITYVPALIVNISINVDSAYFWIHMAPWKRALYSFIFQAFLINHVCNPFIYGFFDSSFRSATMSIFCKTSSK